MFPFFSNGSFFDYAFDSAESQDQDIEQEIKRINRLYVISGTALWFQQWNMVHLTESWHTIFDVPTDEMFLLEDYLMLIENPEERNRIWAARESLIAQPSGFEWCDKFTLHGQKVETFAIVADGCVFGMDKVVG